MERDQNEERIRRLEDALLDYMRRYGPTQAALEAFREEPHGGASTAGACCGFDSGLDEARWRR